MSKSITPKTIGAQSMRVDQAKTPNQNTHILPCYTQVQSGSDGKTAAAVVEKIRNGSFLQVKF
jgi:hypothetical protein